MAASDSAMRGVYRVRNNAFAIWKASAKGYRDGFQGRPVKLADGMLDSEYIRATLAHCEQDLTANWTACLIEANSLRSGIAVRENEIGILLPVVEDLRRKEESLRMQEGSILRKPGEEELDDQLVRARRKSELARELDPVQSARSKKEEQIGRLRQEVCSMRSRILDLERVTALRCNCLESECDEVLAHYVRSALRAMRNPIDPPWTLPRVKNDGRRLYEEARGGAGKASVQESEDGPTTGCYADGRFEGCAPSAIFGSSVHADGDVSDEGKVA